MVVSALRQRRSRPTVASFRFAAYEALTVTDHAHMHPMQQEAQRIRRIESQVSQSLGREPTFDELCVATVKTPEELGFIIDAAPRAQQELIAACKGYVISQVRAFLGSGGKSTGSEEDLVLAGSQSVLQAAYRFNSTPVQGLPAYRFLTYASSYIRKGIMAAIRESA